MSSSPSERWQKWPSSWPLYLNGNDFCDMLIGPCACGAWHIKGEFSMRDGKIVQIVPEEEIQ